MTIWTKRSPPTRRPDTGRRSPPGRRVPAGPVACPGRCRGAAAGCGGAWRGTPFKLLVLLPTLLAALYFFARRSAAIRIGGRASWSAAGRRCAPAALGEAMQSAGFRPAHEDAMGVRDYLQSHDAVAALRERARPGRDVPPAGGGPARPALVGGAERGAAARLFPPHGDAPSTTPPAASPTLRVRSLPRRGFARPRRASCCACRRSMVNRLNQPLAGGRAARGARRRWRGAEAPADRRPGRR